MAMVKIRQTVGPITVWMIIFVALWLTSTVFLVVLYTGQEEIAIENDRLRRANDRLISSAEENSIELTRDARPSQEGGPTVVGLLEQARAEAAFLATGDEADGPDAVRAKRDELVTSIRDDDIVPDAGAYGDVSLFEALTMLYEAFQASDALRRGAEDRVEALDAEVARSVQQNADQKNDLDGRAKDFNDQLAAAEAKSTSYRTEQEAAVAKLREQFDAQREQCDADLTAERQRGNTLERGLAELQKRYVARAERLGEVLAGPVELATAREPDGMVLTAIPGDDVVYVDLGGNDSVTLGLRFSVYPADSGIPADGRAKAQIEVVSVSPASSECRITALAEGAIIMDGDLVANPVYDPHRRLTFLAIGAFDLDCNGELDSDGVEAVKAMITQWGGVTTEELSARTDFVILGGPPRQPKPAGEVPPERKARNDAIRRAWERYTELADSAQRLSVPMMTQDVFLSFLGYSGLRVTH